MKNKKVNQPILKGAKVVVNDRPDATIFEVDEVDGFRVFLKYQRVDGRIVHTRGWTDISILLYPTEEQLRNYQRMLIRVGSTVKNSAGKTCRVESLYKGDVAILMEIIPDEGGRVTTSPEDIMNLELKRA
jgi:hypothetical protein